MESISISILIALVGCFVGVAGWLSKRDDKISHDSEWKGSVDAKLDTIIGIRKDVEDVKNELHNHEVKSIKQLQDHEIRITKLEEHK